MILMGFRFISFSFAGKMRSMPQGRVKEATEEKGSEALPRKEGGGRENP